MTMKNLTKLGEQIRHMSTGCQSDMSGGTSFPDFTPFQFYISHPSFRDLTQVVATVFHTTEQTNWLKIGIYLKWKVLYCEKIHPSHPIQSHL